VQSPEDPGRAVPHGDGLDKQPAPHSDQPVRLRPRPRLRRLSRGAVSAVLIAGLFAVMLLTLRYSRESLAAAPGGSPSKPLGPPPVSLDHLERLRAQRPLREEPPVSTVPLAPPPAPAIRMPAPEPRRRRAAAYRAPLSPGAGGASAPVGQRAASGSAEGQALEEQLARLERDLGLARGGESPVGLAPGSSALRSPPSREPSSALVSWESPATGFLLRAGTSVPAVLSHRVVSDQPGLVRAVVSRDVYDTTTGHHILIPRGALLLGEQANLPTLGQSRLAVSWWRLVLPDGRSLTLGEGDRAPASSAAVDGSLGLPGAVRQHWGRRYGAAALLSLIGAGVQLSQPDRGGAFASPSPGAEAAGALGTELGQLSQEILRRHVDIPPTIELRPGARVSAVLVQDLAFLAPYRPLVP